MDTPQTVRVEELGSDASGYRDAIDERRRVLHVRGSSPREVYAFAAVCASVAALCAVGYEAFEPARGPLVFFGLASVAPVPVLVALLLWRRAQRSRFEITRTALRATHGALRARSVTVEPSYAHSPRLVERQGSFDGWFAGMQSWDLYGERGDGRRVHLATLFDRDGAEHIVRELELAYRNVASPR